MTDTVNLGLPCIEGSQAQKHVTHNDALRVLDTLVQLAVLDRDLTAPPSSPAEGQRWIVKTGATGLWAGHANAVAAWQDGSWQYSVPQIGWTAFVIDEGTLVVWNGTAWGDFFSTVTSLQNLARLGIGTTADATNPFSAKLNNALFAAKTVAEGGDGNLRYKLSKESAAKTLSFLFQDNWSGRAEIGLTGDDDFHLKVSPDGSSWYEGIKIDRSTGAVTFPNTTIAGGRERLAANRIYYVRTDGNDGNSGLADNSGGAFLTPQKAWDTVVGTLDLCGCSVTVQIRSGTYTGGLNAQGNVVGARGMASVVFQGDTTTPSNVVISTTNANAISVSNGGALTAKGFKLVTTTSGNHVVVSGDGKITIDGKMEFGALANGGYNVIAQEGSPYVKFGAALNLTISGGGAPTAFVSAQKNATIVMDNATVIWSASVTYGWATVTSDNAALVSGSGMTLTVNGGVTVGGSRYAVTANSVISSGGGGASYFPGSATGSAASGGQYV